jgi:AraC-like DNA-binding protein
VKELFASDVSHMKLQRLAYGLGPLVTYLRERDIDCQPLFTSAKLSPQSIGDPMAMMSLKQDQLFTLAAIEATRNPGLGLTIGPRYHLSAYGVLGLAMMSSDTLSAGLATIIGLNGLTWSRLRWRELLDGDRAIMEARELEPLEPCLHYMLERDFAAVLMMCREMLGAEMPLQEVHFSYPAPIYAQQYEAVFACPVHFSAERSELLFDASWLEAPLPQANQAVWQVCYNQCVDLMARLAGENSYAQMIECLMLDGAGNFLSLEQVAAKLHTSPRTLRRKLAQEDTSFQELTTEVRSTLAKELLLSGKLSVDQIAERLGYSDSAAFHHAFKRWTGKSPGSYR